MTKHLAELSLMLLLLSAMELQAAMISLSLDDTEQVINVPFAVDILIDGLGNKKPPSLGAFDLDVTYDERFLSVNGADIGKFLGDTDKSEADFVIENHKATANSSAKVNIFEVSFLETDSVNCVFCTPPYLDELQPDGFTLITLTFMPHFRGLTSLGIEVNSISDANGDLLTASSLGIDEITIVPLPATFWLSVFVLASMISVRFLRFTPQQTNYRQPSI